MDKKIVCAAFLAALLSGCGAKSGGVSSVLIGDNAKAMKIIKAEKATYIEEDSYDEELESIITEEILPEPDISLYKTLVAESGLEDGGEYYEEFKEFNIPMAMTPRVSAYIKYFTERIPATTQFWLDRANKYMYLVQDIFIKEGLPTDLVVLGFTESGFNTHAVSHAGAIGMWQFIPSTGRLYGMRNDFWLDERRDFEKSTYAAARYLKSLNNQFKDWYLALAAYNAGPGKIQRATVKHASKDFFTISKNRYTLKLETRDYVPKFLALLIIYKNYLKYGFTPPADKPLLYDNIQLASQTNTYWLSKKLGVSHEELLDLNPALKIPMTPPIDGYILRVPYRMQAKANQVLDNATKEERMQYRVYEGKKGESLANIAKKLGVTTSDLQKMNALKYEKLFADRPVFAKIDGVTDIDVIEVFADSLASLAPKYYKVRKGDTFIAIAHKHNMRTKDLVRLNPNIKPSKIYPGQQIVISEGAKNKK